MNPAVSAAGLVLAYGDRVALHASDFDIPPGALTAVIGPNGSGKSTLLHAIAGLLEPVAGRLAVLGTRPTRAHARVAYVLQSAKVNEIIPITVREVVAMGRYAHLGPFGRFRRRDRAAVADAMERLDIADLASLHLGELSGGQRQRVFVAQGLAQDADLLLLDEPVTALDLVSRDRIMDAAAAEAERGKTVVVTTHDLDEAAHADLVMLLAGRVVGFGAPDEVLTPDSLERAYRVKLVALEDGSIVLDDPFHRTAGRRHVHFDRTGHGDHVGP